MPLSRTDEQASASMGTSGGVDARTPVGHGQPQPCARDRLAPVSPGLLLRPAQPTRAATATPPPPTAGDHAAAIARLDALGQLESHYDPDARALWSYMRPVGRPSFNRALLDDFVAWQQAIDQGFADGGAADHADAGGAPADPRPSLDWLILGSRVPGVFCYGGDLDLFARLIRAGDREGLIAYGVACVTILHRNWRALDRRLVTIGLVEGDALGGGWEALMSFDVIVAERGTRFGLPEISFGLFPGMGAHAFLAQKLGCAAAQRLIASGESVSAETLHAQGLVQILAEPGGGADAVRGFIRRERRRHDGLVGANGAMRLAAPVTLEALVAITTQWADTALRLSPGDLKLMERIVAEQERKLEARAAA